MAIKDFRVGKSPGCDLATAEMIKASGEQWIDVYHHLTKKVWHQGQMAMGMEKINLYTNT